MDSPTTVNNTARNLDINDYLAILLRHKWYFIIPFVLVVAIGMGLALGLPAVYRSEATILIERQEIPKDVVQTTVTGFIQERIEGLTKRILTRDTLWNLAQKYDLYPGKRTPDNKLDIAGKVRENIFVEMQDIKASDSDSMRQVWATYAFTVAFEYPEPEIAQKVAADVANLFLEGNKEVRTRKAVEVVTFLESESARLNKEISALETKLATFKQTQQDQLPELMNMNLKLYEKTETDIDQTTDRIRGLEDQISALQAEVALTDPHQAVYDAQGRKVQSANERLSMLTSDYIRLSSTYSQEHPDVKKIKREIHALGGQSANKASLVELVNQLTSLRTQYSQARQKYGDTHPDVVKLRSSIAAVEKGLRSASGQVGSGSGPSSAPDNPQYVSLQTQLRSAQRSLASERSRLVHLEQKKQEYENRLFKTPVVERDYKTLTRDYDNAKRRYDELRTKLLEARLSQQLESTAKGERFKIVQGAFYPTLPERPNRVGIALLSVFFGFVAGLGGLAFAEYNDQTVRGVRDIQAVAKAPPLAVIPNIHRSGQTSGRSPVRKSGGRSRAG